MVPANVEAASSLLSGENVGGWVTFVIDDFRPFRRGAPEHHHVIFATGRQRLAVRRKRHRLYFAAMTNEFRLFFSSGDVPEAHRLVGTGRGQHFAVGRKSETPNIRRVTCERREPLSRGDLPKLHFASPVAGRHRFAIG